MEKWSNDNPDIKGWYWYKKNINDEDWTAYLIFIDPNQDILEFSNDGVWKIDNQS